MWQIRGHEALLGPLSKSLRDGAYSHAYLVAGPAQAGKGTLAINIAQTLNCLSPDDAPCGECIQCSRIASEQHADVQVIRVQRDADDGPSRREIGIGDVREVQRKASLMPYEGRYRVFIFDGAEYMSEEASNAILKTLEEPPPQVMIILLTAREEALLSTVRSRCRRLELKPLPLAKVAKELAGAHPLGPEEAEKLARLSMGSLGWGLSAAGDPSILERRKEELESIARLSVASLEERFSYATEVASLYSKNREQARQLLYRWVLWWRDLLLIKEGAEEFVHNIDWVATLRPMAGGLSTSQVAEFIRVVLKTLEALEQNANARLALEVLMLSIPSGTTAERERAA